MRRPPRSALIEGAVFGFVAGLVLGLSLAIGNGLFGRSGEEPFRYAASLLLGRAAFDASDPGGYLLVGTGVHLVLSAAFGVAFVLINGALSARLRTGWLSQALLGMGFGALLWIVNVQLIGRALFPWFSELPQGMLLFAQVVGFGLPLGLLHAHARGRSRLAGRPREVRRSLVEGALAGAAAGVLLILAEIAVAQLSGAPGSLPFKQRASLLTGESAFDPAAPGFSVAIGVFIHLGFTALCGLVYGLAVSQLPARWRTGWSRQVALGAAFGAALWVIAIAVIARRFYPWFVADPPARQLVLHVLAFGVPLALFYVAAELRASDAARARVSTRLSSIEQ
jgi:hypothetical protein